MSWRKKNGDKDSHPAYFGERERYQAHNDQSTLHKMKETYWTTKQAVYKRLGRKQDEHIVASDAQLDAKLEVFKAIQKSCMDLLRAIEMYQDRLCALSQEENAMGRFLKAESQVDKTRAGKMMAAVGKAQSFSSQQRLALRVPLVRLYQEVETFRYRAISDTLMTINRMETARTEYRGALMWMKDVSDVLDPDTYKQLEKFRKVQAQVKKTKARFDKLKLDSMQKIDLLAASRCNMFSHVLANYQSTLLHFWSKTSRTMTAVADSFKGYQYYEFNMLKELAETSKKLARDTGNEKESGDRKEKDGGTSEGEEAEESEPEENQNPDDDLLGGGDYSKPPTSQSSRAPAQSGGGEGGGDSMSLFDSCHKCSHPTQPIEKHCKSCTRTATQQATSNQSTGLNSETTKQDDQDDDDDDIERLIQFDEEQGQKDEGSMTNLLQAVDKEIQRGAQRPEGGDDPFIDFEDEDNETTIEAIKQKQDAQFDITAKHFKAAEEKKKLEKNNKNSSGNKDLLSDDVDESLTGDDMALLNEILNTPSGGGDDDFSMEWQSVFGASSGGPGGAAATPTATGGAGATDDDNLGSFMPSNLLDMTRQMGGMNMMGAPGMQQQQMQGGMMAGGMMGGPMGATGGAMMGGGAAAGQQQQQQQQQQKPAKPGQSGKKKTDMSAWFNLFADLDPLADPDAVGRQPNEQSGPGQL